LLRGVRKCGYDSNELKPTPRKGEVEEKEGYEMVHAMRHSMREEQIKRRNGNVRTV
jgi:hypothetical protein